ncbi:MBL fold metallo-hydrolase [Paracoccus sp. S-4012]|uniref:MBL fold metallo-hydrolase n=1 Tax=Paracoccus sp. S-4012 TaxID=2665648 RepID=UPI0012AFFFE3|nr:MBL fold metallo-hydrolase [Paracoccus sp. S-4012]MRX50568.1 MBL fold metallo-hydrolase [Paracoccus sp. S-4012]
MIRATILGCGSSGGVPRIGGNWGACDPSNPKNRRRRCSLLVERVGRGGTTTALIDTGPDFVPQMLDAGVRTLDGVLWTHPHADHIHGIDDLRQVAINARAMVRSWADAPTARALQKRFGYIFETPPGSSYPPVCRLYRIEDQPIMVEGKGGEIRFAPFEVSHGDIPALGFRITAEGAGGLVYLPDVLEIPDAAWPLIEGAEVFVVDALRYHPHPSHAHLALALEWLARSGVPRGVLTNLHHDLDYERLMAETPENVVPAFDGMVIETSG